MEILDDQGIVTDAMDAGSWLHGQTVFVNGQQTHQVDWSGLEELPYAHLGLPQYETERILITGSPPSASRSTGAWSSPASARTTTA